MSLRKGIVVATHPEDHSVDLVMADDGARLVGVQVLTPSGSARTGTIDLPAVPPSGDKWDITKRNGQDMEALVGFMGRHPVVVGFLYPQISQMTFKDPKRKISRHQSDVYQTIDEHGNTEWRHPSGTYVRVGESPKSDDLLDKNFDESFKVDRNKEKSVHLHIALANEGSGEVFTLNVFPDGEVRMWAKGEIKIESEKHIRFFAPIIDLNLDGDKGIGLTPKE